MCLFILQKYTINPHGNCRIFLQRYNISTSIYFSLLFIISRYLAIYIELLSACFFWHVFWIIYVVADGHRLQSVLIKKDKTMKKIIVAIALMVGVFGLVETNANAMNAIVCADSSVMSMQDDGFVSVKLEELPESVQTAIVKMGETYTIKSLAWNAEKEQTKVVAISKENGSESVVILDKDGNEVK